MSRPLVYCPTCRDEHAEDAPHFANRAVTDPRSEVEVVREALPDVSGRVGHPSPQTERAHEALRSLESRWNAVAEIVRQARACKHHDNSGCDSNGVGIADCALKDCHDIYAFDARLASITDPEGGDKE